MTRSEYLTAVATLLQDISVEERKEAMKFYNDYFDEAGDENADQAIKDLGSPEEVAQKIRESLGSSENTPAVIIEENNENGFAYNAYTPAPAKKTFPVWAIVLIVLGALLLLCIPVVTSILSLRHLSNTMFGYNYSNDLDGASDKTVGISVSDDIDSLKISIDAGSLSFETDSDIDTVYCSFEGVRFGEITEEVKGSTYTFTYDLDGSPASTHPEFTVFLPKNFDFKDIEINVGAGDVELDAKIKSHGNVSLNIGAGNLEISDWEVNDISVNCGCGNIEFDGTVNGDFDVKMGTGNVDLEVKGSEKDFNYYVDGALGEFKLNGKSTSGIVGSNKINNNASKTISVDCALGETSIITR